FERSQGAGVLRTGSIAAGCRAKDSRNRIGRTKDTLQQRSNGTRQIRSPRSAEGADTTPDKILPVHRFCPDRIVSRKEKKMKTTTAHLTRQDIPGNGDRSFDRQTSTASLKHWRHNLGVCSIFATVPAMLLSHIPKARAEEVKTPE